MYMNVLASKYLLRYRMSTSPPQLPFPFLGFKITPDVVARNKSQVRHLQRSPTPTRMHRLADTPSQPTLYGRHKWRGDKSCHVLH